MSNRSSMYRDSRWQQKRLEIMERDNWTCRSCGANGEGVMLNVHHAYYDKGRMPWEYPNKSMVTWCEKCHEAITSLQKDIQEGISKLCITQVCGLSELVWSIVEDPTFLEMVNDYGPPSPEELSTIMRLLIDRFEAGKEEVSNDGE